MAIIIIILVIIMIIVIALVFLALFMHLNRMQCQIECFSLVVFFLVVCIH